VNYFEKKQRFLLSLYLFEELGEQDLKHLIQAAAQLDVRKGGFVFNQDEVNDNVYLIW